jgi:hypothetical protein
VIAEWGAGAQLTADRHALTDILQRGHTFAEEGASEPLESLGIMSGDSPISAVRNRWTVRGGAGRRWSAYWRRCCPVAGAMMVWRRTAVRLVGAPNR